MIEYAKKILPKVCSRKELFRKELIKCVKWAGPENRDEIFNWCSRYYSDSHSDILEEVFPGKTEKATRFKKFKDSPATTTLKVCKNSNYTNSYKRQLKDPTELYK